MATFTYRARTKSGRIVSDIIESDNRTSVISKIQQMDYFPIEVVEKGERATGFSIKKKISLSRSRRIKSKDIVLFTRQLSNLINAGMPLLKALTVLARQTENGNLAGVIRSLKSDVQDGKAFSDALAKHPQLFPKLYLGMIKAGEAGGVIEVILNRLADFSEKQQALKDRVKSALAYPVVMLLVGAGTIVFLMAFVIPRFVTMFQDIGQTLPLPTRMLITASDILKGYWWFYLPVLLLAVFIVRQYAKKDEGKMFFDRVKLKLPLLGKMLRKVAIANFTRTLGTLIENGVPILTGLTMTKDTIGNEVIARELVTIHANVKDGDSLARPLARSKEFPPIIADMVAIGEETGKIEDTLVRVADFYDAEIENTIKTLTSLLEPIVILIMGVVVGFIVLAMLLPVFQISSALR